jgi:hypothetical protein
MNNWVNYGYGFSAATYYSNASRVYLSGVIKVDLGANYTPQSGRYPDVMVQTATSSPSYTSYSVICVLPEGYRPTERRILTSISHNNVDPKNSSSVSRIDIKPDGSVVLVQGNTVWLSLDGLSFNI